MRALERLGRVRTSHLTREDSLTSNGSQIRAYVDHTLVARFAEERRNRDQWEDLTGDEPRVLRVDTPKPGLLAQIVGRIGTRTWA